MYTRKKAVRIKDGFNRAWIIENSIDICSQVDLGILTLRALHYRLVARGMTNTPTHYKRVVGAMIKARWDGIIPFKQFSDHDRGLLGSTEYTPTILADEIQEAKDSIRSKMENYYFWRWENQPIIPEVWIEKKAMQGFFQPITRRYGVGLAPTKGYPSLTFLDQACDRFRKVIESGKKPVICYFGDYDASGEDIPRSLAQNIFDIMGEEVEVKRYALMLDQVREWDLPPAPSKEGDSRIVNWEGVGQVELDAVEIPVIQDLCKKAILDHWSEKHYQEIRAEHDDNRIEYRKQLKAFVQDLEFEDEDIDDDDYDEDDYDY